MAALECKFPLTYGPISLITYHYAYQKLVGMPSTHVDIHGLSRNFSKSTLDGKITAT